MVIVIIVFFKLKFPAIFKNQDETFIKYYMGKTSIFISLEQNNHLKKKNNKLL